MRAAWRTASSISRQASSSGWATRAGIASAGVTSANRGRDCAAGFTGTSRPAAVRPATPRMTSAPTATHGGDEHRSAAGRKDTGMRGNVNATPFAARRFWTSVAATIATFAAACLVSGSAAAASEPASFSVKVVREVGRYDFAVTCAFRCSGDLLLRVRREGEPPVFTAAETFEDRAFVSYRLRCDGSRGVNWTIRDRASQERVFGFFRMPTCGRWGPQAGITVTNAKADARRLTIRASRNAGYAYRSTCRRVRAATFECRTTFIVGDSECARRHRLSYEFRSPSFTRLRVKLRGADCTSTYPG